MRPSFVGVVTAALLALCLAAPVSAQYVEGPTKAVFDHADFAVTDHYELAFHALPVANGMCNQAGAPAEAPAQIVPLPKPATTTGVGMEAPLPVKPIGCYVAKLRAVNADGWASEWGAVSNPFGLRAAPPGSIRVVR